LHFSKELVIEIKQTYLQAFRDPFRINKNKKLLILKESILAKRKNGIELLSL